MKKLRAWLNWKRYWLLQGYILYILGIGEWIFIAGTLSDRGFIFVIGAWAFFGLAECKHNERKQD